MRRALRELRGFIFDLDGCVWTGDVLVPGAGEVLAYLRRQGRGVSFLTNNSRARGRTMREKLERLGVEAAPSEVLTPLEILGEVITARWGPSRVLAIGGEELEQALIDGGHGLVPADSYREAGVVVVGNDFALTYERLTAAARAVASGAVFLTPNLDPRLPVEEGDFLPGCGAIVEAVAAAAGARPFVVGKPEPPLFELALQRMGLPPEEAAMVGDSVDSDIRGARRIGMTAVLFAPKGGPDGVAHYMVRSMGQLRRLLGDRPGGKGGQAPATSVSGPGEPGSNPAVDRGPA
jgi:4-nitrophenyl phosphatase